MFKASSYRKCRYCYKMIDTDNDTFVCYDDKTYAHYMCTEVKEPVKDTNQLELQL